MKILSEKLPDLHALYVQQLRLLLSAEELIIRGMPRMAERATDGQLKEEIQAHLLETEAHADRLKAILAREAHDENAKGPLKCKTILSLLDEADSMVQDAAHDTVRDAAVIAAVQRIEHYEIAVYGAMRHFAQVLGLSEDAILLDKSAHEEGDADHMLTEIAYRVNPTAKKAA
jgi:ferritin-like metal-binding protein YciE